MAEPTAASYLTDLLDEHALKRSWVAEAAGVSRATVANVANGRELPGARACARIGIGMEKLVPGLSAVEVAGRLCLLSEGLPVPDCK